MNKRAQTRLIGVTAIIVLAIFAIVFGFAGGDSAVQRGVSEALADSALVGERIKVSGIVVPGSWNKKSNPMIFDIQEKGSPDGPKLKVVYAGSVPNTFGDDIEAIVTGTMTAGKSLEADVLITKCPSKYESKQGATTVTSLLGAGDNVVGRPVKLTGYIVAGSLSAPGGPVRFRMQAESGAGKDIPIRYDGAIPDGFKDGSSVVVGGSLDKAGTFNATSVSMSKADSK